MTNSCHHKRLQTKQRTNTSGTKASVNLPHIDMGGKRYNRVILFPLTIYHLNLAIPLEENPRQDQEKPSIEIGLEIYCLTVLGFLHDRRVFKRSSDTG